MIGRGIEYLEMWDVFRPSDFTVALGSLRERERKVETGVSTKERNRVKCVGWEDFSLQAPWHGPRERHVAFF